MKYKRRPITWAIIVLSVFLFLTPHLTSAAIFRYDGPYQGKVIDADTGEPIEGVVVVGIWDRIHPNVAGWNSEFYDAVETMTDKNGEFYIKGLGPLFFSNIEEMSILIFKTGYDHIGHCLWKSLKVDLILKQKITWNGDVAVIPLKRLTQKQSREYGVPSVGAKVPETKIELLIREINKWRKEQGFSPILRRGGEK